MYINELSTLIGINNLDNDTKEEFTGFLKEKETIDKCHLNYFKNTKIELVNFKLLKFHGDFKIIITYCLIDLDDETCQGILDYSKEYYLKDLAKGTYIRNIIITKFEKWVVNQFNLQNHLISSIKRYYENWKIDSKDEYKEKMKNICINELEYKLNNIAYIESYFIYQDGFQDAFIIRLDSYLNDKLLNSYYTEVSIDGEILDEWME